MNTQYDLRRIRLDFLWRFAPCSGGAGAFGSSPMGRAMLFDPTQDEKRLDRLNELLRRAQAITPELMSEVIAQACVRLSAQSPSAKSKLKRLIETSAWTDTALVLIELELAQWTLRRVVCDDGEWLCSLSKQPWLPLGLDEHVEASHEILPLAILIAFVEARRATASATRPTTVPQICSAVDCAVSCDNYS